MKEREVCIRKESVLLLVSKSEVNYAEKVDGTFGLITFATVVDQCLSFVILPRENDSLTAIAVEARLGFVVRLAECQKDDVWPKVIF